MTRTIRTTQALSGKNMLRDYNHLKSQGYTRLWAGNGQICMEEPEVPTEVPQEVVVEIPSQKKDETVPDWTALEHAIALAELQPQALYDFMWMCESPRGVHQYKNCDTRNYAHLTGTETRDEALIALTHAYNAEQKWADRPARTAAVRG